MSKSKISKEYYILVSLIIFFSLVIIVGTIRVVKATKESFDEVDLSKIDNILEDSNVDVSSVNLRIKNSIEKEYGIDIYYGDGYYVESVNAVPITDANTIFEMLKQVNIALSKYPKNMIREIEQKGYTVSIYLVNYFTNDVEALANRNSIGEFKIYMSNTINVERATHHEYYHILDYYIKLETQERYTKWESLNPKGFKYPNDVKYITAKYVYNGLPGAYFVTAYAKYSDKEDRAETFAEMITANKDEEFFKDGEKIKDKMNLIKDVLRTNFKTVGATAKTSWE